MGVLGYIALILATTFSIAETRDGFSPKLNKVWAVDCTQDYQGCNSLCYTQGQPNNPVAPLDPDECLKVCNVNLQTCQRVNQ